MEVTDKKYHVVQDTAPSASLLPEQKNLWSWVRAWEDSFWKRFSVVIMETIGSFL